MRGKLAAWLVFVGVLVALAYGNRAAAGKPPKNALYEYSFAAAGLVQYVVMLALALAIASGPELRSLLGLRPPRSWPRALGRALAVLVGTYVLVGVASTVSNPGGEQGLTPSHWEAAHAGAFAANFVVVAGVAPVVEELTFRGVGYSLLERYGKWAAIVLVGVLFGLVHGLVQALPLLAAFGAGLAWLRDRTGSVYPCMLVHAAFNAIALAAAVTA
jgi:membrane protease YdiL (CAAX protease family)